MALSVGGWLNAGLCKARRQTSAHRHADCVAGKNAHESSAMPLLLNISSSSVVAVLRTVMQHAAAYKAARSKGSRCRPHAVYYGEFCDTLQEARAAGAAPRTPFKKDGLAVNGCFQSIDEEAPNWQALIETLVRIIFSSGTFAPTWRADSANHGARECERTPHPRAVWAASCPASCGDSGRSDAAHPLCPARRVALPPREKSW